MKRGVAVIAACLIGLGAGSLNTGAADVQEERMPKATPSNLEKQAETGDKEPVKGRVSEITNLQIPQRLAVVLDPWEMDGKGQIYSEEYVIQNMGKMPGTLTLSFVCRLGEGSGVSVKSEREELHDDDNKSLYIKIVFGNGDEVCLSEESTEYKTKLEEGEELTIRFEGELNENASESWADGDVSINGIYFWNREEAQPKMNFQENAEEFKKSEKRYATPSNAEHVCEEEVKGI